MTIKLFIPSYNRPIQCNALLESLKLHDKMGLFGKIEVCYEGTTDRLKEGYKKLVEEQSSDKIKFIPKSGNHYSDVLSSLEECDFWSVSTDDSIIYRNFELTEEQLDKHFINTVNHFSLRLGYNTITIDYENPAEKHYLNGDKLDNNLVRFYWPNHSCHYRHAFALDSFVSRSEYVKQLIIRSCSPSDFGYRYFECKMNEYINMHSNKPFALCFRNSVLVNVPSNKVNDGPYLKNGVIHPYSVDELNDKWLDGYKIDINTIKEEEIDNVQMEIKFEFIK